MENWIKKALSVLALLTLAMSASAAPIINGTFGYAPFGSITYTGSDLGDASTVTIPSQEQINTLPTTYLGLANDFVTSGVAYNDTVTVDSSDLTLTVSNINLGFYAVSLPLYISWSSSTSPADRFHFDITSISWSSSASTNLSFLALGDFSDSLGNYASDTTAELSGSFTVTGIEGAINGSFTFADPPPSNNTPEPATTVLIGASLIGLAAMRRKQA